ncbi:MAG: hypothetical protein N4J56_001768 [Chroococcidiopsis sp. SAG 2025]|uniref:hypothetical protein n=1 Tax=Chroococcidiopsis sp. SAG 2025 TaxID=171389 RepID=UPI0029371BC8|nr:hypothetical protein [Chroococcidiopsis sp. SAG 2025]MDV2992114.1 hypothetical protein [Chroococcidiopsis sp. SAG 2025]
MSKNKGGSAGDASITRSRVKPMGRTDTIQWEDIPESQQHLYLQVGKRLYNKAGLSPQQLAKFDTQFTTAEGYQACEIKRQTFGGNVRIVSDRVLPTEASIKNLEGDR